MALQGEETAESGLLFPFSDCHVIIVATVAQRKEQISMTNKKQNARTRMARIAALVTAGVLVFSILITYVLK